jgi:hypothetical protein
MAEFDGSKSLLVKVVGSVNRADGRSKLSRQLLGGWAAARGLRFTFDPDARGYDWLVVYENLPASAGERRSLRAEALDCPAANTILLTSEPSAIKIYGRAFTAQFGHVVTSQEPFALRHPGRIWSQAGLRWFYGEGSDSEISADEIAAHEPEKSAVLSTVCSTKRQGHTLHRLRYDFTMALKERMPALDVFGRGHRSIDDKAEAIDAYKYHLAIENHIAPHHFTEKLADPFLGLALPFYFGAPNAADYFPADSFIAIDIRKPDEAFAIISAAIDNNDYEKRLPAIREARHRVLTEHSLFPLIDRVIKNAPPAKPGAPGGTLLSQRRARAAHPLSAIADLIFRETLHLKNRLANAAR